MFKYLKQLVYELLLFLGLAIFKPCNVIGLKSMYFVKILPKFTIHLTI